jgi:hypothetical protein
MSTVSSPSVEDLTPEPQRAQPTEAVGDSSTSRTIRAMNSALDDTRRTNSSDTTNEARSQSPQVDRQPSEAERPIAANNAPVEDDLDRELQELEAWHQRATKLQKVARLRAAQARYLAGDVDAVQTVHHDSRAIATTQVVPTSGLPRPQPPHVFAKRNRADYNCWKRDCERSECQAGWQEALRQRHTTQGD